MKSKYELKKLSSFFLGLFLMATPLAYTSRSLGFGYFFAVGYLIEVFSFIGICLGNLNISKPVIPKTRNYTFLFLLILFFYLLVSFIITPEMQYTVHDFVYYVALCACVSFCKFETKKVLETILVLSFLFVPATNGLFSITYESLHQANMGTLYSTFLVVSAMFLYLIFCFRNEKRWKFVLFIPACIVLINTFLLANRGVILSFVALIIILIINWPKNGVVNAHKKQKSLIFVVFALIIFVNFDSVFQGIYSFFESNFSQMPSFLIKTNKYLFLDDLGNGRSQVYQEAFNLINQRLIFGYGIESFPVYTEYSYPHNFFVQILFESGLILGFVPILLVFYSFYLIFVSKKVRVSIISFLILLFLQAFPRLLFSGTIWTNQYFWMLLFYCISLYMRRKKIYYGYYEYRHYFK